MFKLDLSGLDVITEMREGGQQRTTENCYDGWSRGPDQISSSRKPTLYK